MTRDFSPLMKRVLAGVRRKHFRLLLPLDWMSTGATAVTKPPAEDLRDKVSPSIFSTNGSLLLTTMRLELDAARSWFFPFSIFKRNFKGGF